MINDNDLPPEGHPLRALGARLAYLLDSDHWHECERLLLEGWDYDRAKLAEAERRIEFQTIQIETLTRSLDGCDNVKRREVAEAKLAEAEQERDAAYEAAGKVIDERDLREEQIEQIYAALGGEGEWRGVLPPQEPPDSGDLGADALALAHDLKARVERLEDLLGLLRIPVSEACTYEGGLEASLYVSVDTLNELRAVLEGAGIKPGPRAESAKESEMNPIIEAAAKARWIYLYGPDEPWDVHPAGVQRREMLAMRVALREMAKCEPTEVMVNAIFTVHSRPLDAVRDIWRALLLAAAEGGE